MAVLLRVRATLTYGSGGPGLFTAYFTPGTVGGSTADATDCVARVRACFFALTAYFNNTYTIQVQSDVAAIEATTGALTGQFSATPVSVVTGTATGTALPAVTQVLVRIRTGTIIGGRQLRGRHYIGPTSTVATLLNSIVAATAVAAFNTAFNAMLVTTPTTSFPAVWHRPVNGTGGGHSLVSSYSTWDQFAELRSRRDG